MKRPSVKDLLGLDDVADAPDAVADFEAAFGYGFGGDSLNAHGFAKAHAGRLMYVPQWKQWLEFADHCWRPCDAEWLIQAWAAKRAQDAITAETRKGTREAAAETKVSTKLFMDRRSQLHALGAAKSLPMIRRNAFDLDADPYSIGVRNGVVDLRTGRLRPGQPEDRMTKQAGCAFDPDAEAPLFMDFLKTVQPDPQMRALLRRAVGYTLFGLMDAEVFFFIFGEGGTGKSTFGNVIAKLMGDYTAVCDKRLMVRTLHSSEYDRQTHAVRGKRLASVNETSVGDVFDDVKIKAHAGREDVSARALYGESNPYMPTHTVWMRGNFQPGVLDGGDGFWRRIIPIGFNVQIPPAERVGDLDRRIVENELPGVLAWAVRGAVEWRERGLGVPQSVEEERDSYRAMSDVFGQWMADCTTRERGAKVKASDLYDSYCRFMAGAGLEPANGIVFGKELTRRGIVQDPSRANGRRRVGLKLNQSGRFADVE